MDLTALIDALARPAAYPHPVPGVEVRQTHISAVFLAGPFAYKVKKPVRLGYLDFSTPEQRRHFCHEEVRLNRRLAPHVYLGVVPVTSGPEGVRIEGGGEVVEWAVKMERLPEGARLRDRLGRGEVDVALIEALAARVAAFHRGADRDDRLAPFGRFDAVERVVRDVLAQAEPRVGTTVSRAVLSRLTARAAQALARLRPLIDARAARGTTRDGHGDLRLDHVYHFPDRPAAEGLVIIDCIEFNERLRFLDPVADMAFLVMDLAAHGRRDLAAAFAAAYFRHAADAEGEALLPLYVAYRAAVRGAVDGLLASEPEVPAAARARALARARGYWVLALGELEAPAQRPALALVSGLPGTGKSTLARGLAGRAGFQVIRSDVVRKELAAPPADVSGGLYTPEWDDRTYAECLRRAEAVVFDGGRALVDATFREERRRRAFLDAAARWGAPAVVLVCQADPAVVRARLEARRGDASDAGWAEHVRLAARWEEPGEATLAACRPVNATLGAEQALAQALDALRALGLG